MTKDELKNKIADLEKKISTNLCGDPQDIIDMQNLRALKAQLSTVDTSSK